MNMVDRLKIYVQLMRLDKPIGILLLLWPMLWGLSVSYTHLTLPTNREV